ncbi:MAG: hypothetical protein WCQ95_01495 [Bacteroidota bacterium]
MKPIQNIELIEIQFVQGINKYKIPTQTNFKGKKIVGIEAHGSDTALYSPLGREIEVIGTIGGYLSLDVAGREKVKQMPLMALNPGLNIFPRPFEGLIINNDKSYIELPAITVDATMAAKSILLLFFFED